MHEKHIFVLDAVKTRLLLEFVAPIALISKLNTEIKTKKK